MDVARIQEALRDDDLDGWLLYDFHGSNPIARRITGLHDTAKLTTRRWYYLIPATGEPLGLVHDIERDTLAHLPGGRLTYAGRAALETGLTSLLRGVRRVALEYSPDCAIPYVSRVDAGTVDTLRRLGLEPVSSGDLVQRFEAAWDDTALATHRAASEHLYTVKDRTFALIRDQLAAGSPTEYSVQQRMVEWFTELGLVTDCPPVVAAQESSGNPHYLPSASAHRPIGPDQVVLIDLWGKLESAGAVYADITWVGYTGATPPDTASEIFRVACAARDAAVSLVADRVRARQPIGGFEVDRAARDVVVAAGFGEWFMHRTGHSLGEEVHGNGVHMDDYETHDERRLIAGSGFTIEPGIYLEEFGVRTEINVYVSDAAATVTGPQQSDLVRLLPP